MESTPLLGEEANSDVANVMCSAKPARVAGLGRFLREVALVTVLFVSYNLGRMLASRDTGAAFTTARWLWETERRLHLPSEQVVQALVLNTRMLVRAANGYYAWVHFPLTLAVLLWLFFRRPAHYLWARRALAVATAGSLVLYVTLPVAPPRMMASLGFVDTAALYGQSIYHSDTMSKLANQFAAMPSLHVGWALLLAVVLVAGNSNPLRWLWFLHPAVTLLVVVVTANHYWLDGIVGIVVVLVALLLTRGAVQPAGSERPLGAARAENPAYACPSGVGGPPEPSELGECDDSVRRPHQGWDDRRRHEGAALSG